MYFSASRCDEDWDVVLPTLRVYVLGGGTENPLSADYELLGPIKPLNFDDGMLDAVCHGAMGRQMDTCLTRLGLRRFMTLETPHNFFVSRTLPGVINACILDAQYSSVDGPASPDGASLWAAELLSPTECDPATLIAGPEYNWE